MMSEMKLLVGQRNISFRYLAIKRQPAIMKMNVSRLNTKGFTRCNEPHCSAICITNWPVRETIRN